MTELNVHTEKKDKDRLAEHEVGERLQSAYTESSCWKEQAG